MTDNKNTLIAIVLSALVLIGWQYFVGMPQMEKQRQEAQLKQQQQQAAPAPQAQPGATPQPNVSTAPG
ncbi:MAG: rane protein insertase, YidC/Oxa1 family protein, partial [Xanthobacteraceae bacterium]|nr:rane protein insertase, YidC/Oxa1 family protein [Xanthobacteraceae bacterium]